MVGNAYDATRQVRQIILRTNASIRDTLLQDVATRDLEKLQISNFSEIVKFSQSYHTFEAKTGTSFNNNELNKR